MARVELTTSDIEKLADLYSTKFGFSLYVRPCPDMDALDLIGYAYGVYSSKLISKVDLYNARNPKALVLSYMDWIRKSLLEKKVERSIPNFISTYSTLSSTSILSFPMFQLEKDFNLEALALRQDYDVMMEKPPLQKPKPKKKVKVEPPPTKRVIDLGD